MVVTALWDAPEAYQRWLDNPARDEYRRELEELLIDPDDREIQGDLYDVVITAKADGADA